MSKSDRIAQKKGFTLIELIIIVAIVSILASSLAFSYQGWIGGYNVESQVKNVYTNLMNARVRAMGKCRNYFLSLPSASGATTYTLYEDTNPAPDGDGIQTGSDTVLPGYPKTVQYPMDWNGPLILTFNTKGMVSPSGTNTLSLTVPSYISADYDCIVISDTRIRMGKMTGGSCAVK